MMMMNTSTSGDQKLSLKSAANQTSPVEPLYDLFNSGYCEPLQSSSSSTSSDVSLLWKLSHHIGSQQLEHLFSGPLSEALAYLKDVSTCVENYLKNVFSAYLSASDFTQRVIASDKASLVAEEVARNDSLKLAAIDRKLDAILDAITASKLEIINSIQYSHIKPIISYLETLKGYFKAELQYIHVTGYERIQRLEGDHEEMNYLQESRLPKPGTLYTLLNDVINQEMAIPKTADDTVAFMVLDLLVTSTETYFLTANFLLNYYRQVAIAFYHLKNTDQFNKFYSMGIDNFNDLLTENQLGLIAKVEKTLEEAEATGFQGTAPEFKHFFANSRKLLNDLRENLKSTAALLPNELPKRITEKLDFSNSPLSTPTGKWVDYRKVSYAIQYRNESNAITGMTVISKWTIPWTIHGKATPMVGIPKDLHGRTRIVFRRFDNEEPEMAATITDPTVTSFRDIDRELFNAAMEPNEELASKEIEKYLKLQANVNAVFEKGRGPMHMAAQNGNVALVKKLKLKKAKVDIKDYNGYTPFHNAAFKRQVKFCQEVLKSGLIPANILAANRFTPLHSAVMSGGENIVLVFTQHREINLEAQSDRGLTALHLAALHGFASIVSILLDAKVLVNSRSFDGLTALDMAIKNKKKAVIDILLARVEIDVNLRDYRAKLSPLHLAALTDQQKVAQQLIEKGANIDSASWEGRTPLHLAIQYNRTAIVDVLLNSGANYNAPAGAWSPLQLAIIYRNEQAVFKLLKNRSIDLNFQEARTRFSALHLAAKYDQAEVASELLRRGAQLELTAEQSKTPLHVAAIANSVKVLELLLQSGANASAQTADGDTSLEICRKLKNDECEDLLESWLEDRTVDVRRRRRPKLGIAKSSASRPASVINHLIASIQSTLHGLTFGAIGRFQNLSLRNIEFNSFLPKLSSDKVNFSPDYSTASNVDVNGSILLLELVSRKLTQHKVINNSELQMNDFEARAIALNLTFSKAEISFETYRLTYWQLMNGYLQKEF